MPTPHTDTVATDRWTIEELYAESGCNLGCCPLCDSPAFNDGYCEDCGTDLFGSLFNDVGEGN